MVCEAAGCVFQKVFSTGSVSVLITNYLDFKLAHTRTVICCQKAVTRHK